MSEAQDDMSGAYFPWSKKGVTKFSKKKPVAKYDKKSNMKIVDIFKYYLKRCLDMPIAGMSQTHIQLMCSQLQQFDDIKFAVRLELTMYDKNTSVTCSEAQSGSKSLIKEQKTRAKYLVIVVRTATVDNKKVEQNALFGFDIAENRNTTIGMKFPIVSGVRISLYGDGKFMINSPSDNFNYVFRPISVQAMWYCIQTVERCVNDCKNSNGAYKSRADEWVNEYSLTSTDLLMSEWKIFPDREFANTLSSPILRAIVADELSDTERTILKALRVVTPSFDLQETSSKVLREAVQKYLDERENEDESASSSSSTIGRINLQNHKSTFDKLMMITCNQIDAPSKIFEHLYLGNEGNATNKEELKKIGITHILNISNEIDNVYPHDFVYEKIQVNDEPTVDLMRYWKNLTFDFIESAREKKGKVLVHCKMGMSRSAATVIAYAMKYKKWTNEEAFEHARSRRPIICPNEGFVEQLKTYSGILEASRNKKNPLWHASSVEDGCHNKDVKKSHHKQYGISRLRKMGSSQGGSKKEKETTNVFDQNIAPVKQTKELFESGMFDVCVQLPTAIPNANDGSIPNQEVEFIDDVDTDLPHFYPLLRERRSTASRSSFICHSVCKLGECSFRRSSASEIGVDEQNTQTGGGSEAMSLPQSMAVVPSPSGSTLKHRNTTCSVVKYPHYYHHHRPASHSSTIITKDPAPSAKFQSPSTFKRHWSLRNHPEEKRKMPMKKISAPTEKLISPFISKYEDSVESSSVKIPFSRDSTENDISQVISSGIVQQRVDALMSSLSPEEKPCPKRASSFCGRSCVVSTQRKIPPKLSLPVDYSAIFEKLSSCVDHNTLRLKLQNCELRGDENRMRHSCNDLERQASRKQSVYELIRFYERPRSRSLNNLHERQPVANMIVCT